MQEEKDDKVATLVMNKTLIYGPSLTTRHLVHIILVSLIYPNRRLVDNWNCSRVLVWFQLKLYIPKIPFPPFYRWCLQSYVLSYVIAYAIPCYYE